MGVGIAVRESTTNLGGLQCDIALQVQDLVSSRWAARIDRCKGTRV